MWHSPKAISARTLNDNMGEKKNRGQMTDNRITQLENAIDDLEDSLSEIKADLRQGNEPNTVDKELLYGSMITINNLLKD